VSFLVFAGRAPGQYQIIMPQENILETPAGKNKLVAKRPRKVGKPSPLQPLAGTRQEGESDKAVLACNDYLRLPNRSLRKLRNLYSKQVAETEKPSETERNRAGLAVPTSSLGTLYEWSATFDWFARSVLFDVSAEQEKDEIHKASMRTGVAAPFERLAILKEMTALIEEELFSEDDTGRLHNLWLAEPRAIPIDDGNGNVKMEIFDIYRYNAPLVSQLFQVLDDIAKETNGRRVGDRAEKLLMALIMKVGADRLPLNLVNRIAAGEGAYEVFIDAINELDVSSLPTYHNAANSNGGN